MRIAIIDLGTNTFNLLIAEVITRDNWIPVYKFKEAVKLGQGGINKGFIASDAFERGLSAMANHYERIKNYNVEKIFAFGTSALRDALNGKLFIETIKEKFNIEIVLITGEKEAELICKGVWQTFRNIQEKFLILDIGGGSNEFIIADHQQLYWKESYKLGMARLMEQFVPPDPITPEVIDALEKYFEEELKSLFVALEKHPLKTLIGASGSFDSLVNMLHWDVYPTDEKLPLSQKIDIAVFNQIYTRIIISTSAERERIKGLEPVRRDMIVLAVIFVNFILKKLKIEKLYQSSYALKEGALWEVMQIL